MQLNNKSSFIDLMVSKNGSRLFFIHLHHIFVSKGSLEMHIFAACVSVSLLQVHVLLNNQGDRLNKTAN